MDNKPFQNATKREKLLLEKYEFRTIHQDEAEIAGEIEQICFPPNEACSKIRIKERIQVAADLFFVVIDKQTGEMAGFLNGIATDESAFRDEFFIDAALHNPDGQNVMLLGLDVLPEYRMQGLATEIVFQYLRKEYNRNRKKVVLTCLDHKVLMYQKMGFKDLGKANSTRGAEEWHEMSYDLNM